MPSPFPGMNPYLEHEDVFHGFHQRLIVEISNALVPQIRPAYIADTDVNVYIHELSGDERLLGRPDVHIAKSGPAATPAAKSPSSSSVRPIPSALPSAVDIVEIPFIKILDRQSRQVITVIEILSPTNKLKSDDRIAYMGKRNELRRSDVHFIEIDLLRAGVPMPLTDTGEGAYRVVLSRAQERPNVSLWALHLKDPLPRIPVPLRSPDPDAVIDLQDVLHRVYDQAGYADYIYTAAPQPPLTGEETDWAKSLLRNQ